MADRFPQALPFRWSDTVLPSEAAEPLARLCIPPETARSGDILGVTLDCDSRMHFIRPILRLVTRTGRGAAQEITWRDLEPSRQQALAPDMMRLNATLADASALFAPLDDLLLSDGEDDPLDITLTPRAMLATKTQSLQDGIDPPWEIDRDDSLAVRISDMVRMVGFGRPASSHEELMCGAALRGDAALFASLLHLPISGAPGLDARVVPPRRFGPAPA